MAVFKKVLIPVDGSEFSERSLKFLEHLQGAPTLLQVVAAEEETAAAQTYLTGLAAKCEREVATSIRAAEEPSTGILEEVEQGGYDLVVLMTHGYSGVKRWVLGSVAEEVIRRCPTPILISNPSYEFGADGVGTILVPLDGSELADAILELVKPLAKAQGAEVVLFSAVWLEPTSNPMAFDRDLSIMLKESEAKLQEKVKALTEAGIKARYNQVRAYPEESILQAAEAAKADLIAMTTHGRTGVKRWLLGSVAERVLRSSPLPVLLLRSAGDD